LPHPASCASLVFQQKKVDKYRFKKTESQKQIFQGFIFILGKGKPYGENILKSVIYTKYIFNDVKQLNHMNKTSQPVLFQSIHFQWLLSTNINIFVIRYLNTQYPSSVNKEAPYV